MNRKRLVLLFGFLVVVASSFGQEITHSPTTSKIIRATPREQLYVHVNSTLLFPGEYLLYKVYALTSSDENNLSEIANVELISENGEQVFLQKIALNEGTGHADFFVPTSLPSGNYKLVAYTNWMRNFNDRYFLQDISVINPYQSHQGHIFETDSLSSLKKYNNKLETASDSIISLSLEKKKYGNREKIALQLEKGNTSISGNYSISVRKIGELPVVKRLTAKEIKDSWKEIGAASENFYLPELRGQILAGKIREVNGSSELQLKDRSIALSLPDENSFPIIVATDEYGRFFFNLSKNRQEENVVLQMIGKGKEEFHIELQSQKGVDVSSLQFPTFLLHPRMQEEILDRSVSNQIENAFFRIKPDTLVPSLTEKRFYDSFVTTYELDDYKRFKTIPETFVEIINSAWIKRNKQGEQVFEVRGLEKSMDMKQLPMILIDGVLIQDHGDLIELSAQEIKRIEIIRKKLFVGAEIYQGAILVQTIDGDFGSSYVKPYIKKVNLARPAIKKKYFHQIYGNDTSNDRIPDMRYQLLWMPNLNLEETERVIDLYSSDIDGEFEVVLEGFSENGNPVSIRRTFTVQ